ncbi:MAG: ferritin family protein [Thermoplasmata archaeon]
MGFSKNPVELVREKKLTREEIISALRDDIAAEIDAINFYLSQARLIDNKKVKDVLMDIAKEEKVHLGEFMVLLEEMDHEQVDALKAGSEEVEKI